MYQSGGISDDTTFWLAFVRFEVPLARLQASQFRNHTRFWFQVARVAMNGGFGARLQVTRAGKTFPVALAVG